MKKASRTSIVDIFSGVSDPRDPDRIRHELSILLFIGLCTLLSHGEDYTDMVEFAKQRYDWLSKKVDLGKGIPSHDTFNRVFNLLSPSELETCLGKDLLDHLEEKQLCLDGKKLRGASPKSRGTDGIYILNAW